MQKIFDRKTGSSFLSGTSPNKIKLLWSPFSGRLLSSRTASGQNPETMWHKLLFNFLVRRPHSWDRRHKRSHRTDQNFQVLGKFSKSLTRDEQFQNQTCEPRSSRWCCFGSRWAAPDKITQFIFFTNTLKLFNYCVIYFARKLKFFPLSRPRSGTAEPTQIVSPNSQSGEGAKRVPDFTVEIRFPVARFDTRVQKQTGFRTLGERGACGAVAVRERLLPGLSGRCERWGFTRYQ
jgi:hypothetical protein